MVVTKLGVGVDAAGGADYTDAAPDYFDSAFITGGTYEGSKDDSLEIRSFANQAQLLAYVPVTGRGLGFVKNPQSADRTLATYSTVGGVAAWRWMDAV